MEMERDSAISHGSSAFLQERLMYSSDVYSTVFCKKCGTIARANVMAGSYLCKVCRQSDEFGSVDFPYTMKNLNHNLNGLGFNVTMNLDSEEEYTRRMQGNLSLGIDEGIEASEIDLEAEEIEEEMQEEQMEVIL